MQIKVYFEQVHYILQLTFTPILSRWNSTIPRGTCTQLSAKHSVMKKLKGIQLLTAFYSEEKNYCQSELSFIPTQQIKKSVLIYVILYVNSTYKNINTVEQGFVTVTCTNPIFSNPISCTTVNTYWSSHTLCIYSSYTEKSEKTFQASSKVRLLALVLDTVTSQ